MSKEPVKKFDWAGRGRVRVSEPKGVTTQTVLDVLADAFVLDRSAISALMNHWTPCNQKLSDHPTIQTEYVAENYFIDFVGIINGILGASGQPLIVEKRDDNDKLIGFEEQKS